jgi:SAM-dependent methyltransferase
VTTASDGSPVDLFLRVPSFGEAERIHELIPAGAGVLELGCGVGRVTHGLVRLGHPVTAVDESEAMLAHVRGAEVIRGRIEELDLRRRFDTWRHPLVARLLDDDELDEELRAVGLRLTRVLGEPRTWVEARLCSGA